MRTLQNLLPRNTPVLAVKQRCSAGSKGFMTSWNYTCSWRQVIKIKKKKSFAGNISGEKKDGLDFEMTISDEGLFENDFISDFFWWERTKGLPFFHEYLSLFWWRDYEKPVITSLLIRDRGEEGLFLPVNSRLIRGHRDVEIVSLLLPLPVVDHPRTQSFMLSFTRQTRLSIEKNQRLNQQVFDSEVKVKIKGKEWNENES